jgi:nucleotide-binding universal stress UspA family protein
MKKILVPCDFSNSARQAYYFAMNIAAHSDADVFVVKAIDMPLAIPSSFGIVPFTIDPIVTKALEEDAIKEFEKMKAQHFRQDRVTFFPLQGSVTETVLEFIPRHNIDLVVMGTLGTSGLEEYFVGSNTEKIVRYSPVPVMAVRKSVDLSKIKNIVFPTTLEFDQGHLVNKIKELQGFFSAQLHLLIVNTPHNLNRTKDEMETMDEYVKFFKFQNYTINTRNDFREQDGIINFANEIKADMIAMGTHGRRGLSHLFMGSVTESVVNHVDCPIWTLSIRKNNGH